jgi:hypothetical protein
MSGGKCWWIDVCKAFDGTRWGFLLQGMTFGTHRSGVWAGVLVLLLRVDILELNKEQWLEVVI